MEERARSELSAWLPRLGIDGIPERWLLAPVAAQTPERPSPTAAPEPLAEPMSAAPEPAAAPPSTSDAPGPSWNELESTALSCRKCRLSEGRNKVVFGVGKRDRPLIAFVGEGPGADEDRVGEPFVGRAGALLTAAITNGLGLRREDVYIANVVKCRPPGNRAPLPDEVAACTPYLYRQLELLAPRVIVTLGQPAQKALSGVDMGITKLRGRWQQWRGIPLMPTFHPAYILRNPPAKRFFWEDLQSVMLELGLPVPNRGAKDQQSEEGDAV